MHVRKASQVRQRGVVLILTLIVAVILMGLGLLLIALIHADRQMTEQIGKKSQTFYVSDVESSYGAIARAVLAQESQGWTNLLNNYGAINQGNCDASYTPPPVVLPANDTVPVPCQYTSAALEPIPSTQEYIANDACKGTILRVPAGAGWKLDSPGANPFGIICGDAKKFCNCQFDDPSTFVTLFIKDDLRDAVYTPSGYEVNSDPLEDTNGSVLLTVTTMARSRAAAVASVKTSLMFSLMAYNIIEHPCKNPELTGACEE